MGRRPKGQLFVERRLNPLIHTPGRSAFLGVVGNLVTILYATKREAFVYCWLDESIRRVGRARDLMLTADKIPRRSKRLSDGRWCVYLGRRHPLSNAAGFQYEGRLVAMGKFRQLNPPVCLVADRDRTRDPTVLSRKSSRTRLTIPT